MPSGGKGDRGTGGLGGSVGRGRACLSLERSPRLLWKDDLKGKKLEEGTDPKQSQGKGILQRFLEGRLPGLGDQLHEGMVRERNGSSL